MSSTLRSSMWIRTFKFKRLCDGAPTLGSLVSMRDLVHTCCVNFAALLGGVFADQLPEGAVMYILRLMMPVKNDESKYA
ncbi:MAG: hypothetical protein ACJAVI_001867 [Candidatus Azotimanducaceae bacterium]|jgi:hypothetical protein